MRISREGSWLQTFRGFAFWPMDPRADEIDIEEIAHALSLLCRYNGHCLRFYSVAEHSVLMAHAVAPEYRRWALLHDAAEAYLADVPRPVKPFLGGYANAEARLMAEVAKRFDLTMPMPAAVKEADNRILHDEKAQNMAPCPHDWNLPHEPLGVTLQFWSPEHAEEEFMSAWIDARAMAEVA